MTPARCRLETRKGALELGGEPLVAGILNVTPDSFSDGGRFLDLEAAVAHAGQLVADGADLIDVGACSSRPGSEPVSEEEELCRLLPVVERLAAEIPLPISIDTFRAAVFRRCFEAGADVLNDIWATRADPEMPAILADTAAPVILMHMQGEPGTMQADPRYDDPVRDIVAWFADLLERLERFGVSCARTVLDPGLGFGKTLAHNLALMRRIDEFHELDRPLMVGASRKSFIGSLLGRDEPAGRDAGTAATSLHLRERGVQLLRVHDVRATVDVLAMTRILDGDDETWTPADRR